MRSTGSATGTRCGRRPRRRRRRRRSRTRHPGRRWWPGRGPLRAAHRRRHCRLADTQSDGEPGEGDVLTSVEHLTGGHADDRLAGDDHHSIISGEAGSDVLLGRGGNDLLFGDSGADRLVGGDGSDEFLTAGGGISCGAGRFDRVIPEGGREYLRPDCERVNSLDAPVSDDSYLSFGRTRTEPGPGRWGIALTVPTTSTSTSSVARPGCGYGRPGADIGLWPVGCCHLESGRATWSPLP
jgi:hypothetical protein